MSRAPVGLFDSGVGGLSVYREVRRQLPHENLVYVADQAHVPYGPRPLEEVRRFAEGITRFLLARGAKAIVVACNTASAAALKELRTRFPQTPFIGMEPAVKPAAEHSRSRTIGVIATPATFQGELFASVVDRFAKDVKVMTQTCPGLVDEIEKGTLDGPSVTRILEPALAPLREAGIDSLVLGCTHYPFVVPAIRRILVRRSRSSIRRPPSPARSSACCRNAHSRTKRSTPEANGSPQAASALHLSAP